MDAVIVRAPVREESGNFSPLVRRLESDCRAAGWRVHPSLRGTTIHSRSSNASGRLRRVLTAQDAKHLYELAHQARLTVFTTAPVMMRLDARADPAADKLFIPLARFLRYKAVVIRLPIDAETSIAIRDAERAAIALSCDGARDPRILPLHVFAPSQDVAGLETLAGQQRFARAFGGPGSLEDSEERAWRNGPSHGRTSLTVAGASLPRGWHWDVQAGRNQSTINTGWEVWQMAAGRGHLNVTPDASARAGRLSRRIWHFGIEVDRATSRTRGR